MKPNMEVDLIICSLDSSEPNLVLYQPDQNSSDPFKDVSFGTLVKYFDVSIISNSDLLY